MFKKLFFLFAFIITFLESAHSLFKKINDLPWIQISRYSGALPLLYVLYNAKKETRKFQKEDLSLFEVIFNYDSEDKTVKTNITTLISLFFQNKTPEEKSAYKNLIHKKIKEILDQPQNSLKLFIKKNIQEIDIWANTGYNIKYWQSIYNFSLFQEVIPGAAIAEGYSTTITVELQSLYNIIQKIKTIYSNEDFITNDSREKLEKFFSEKSAIDEYQKIRTLIKKFPPYIENDKANIHKEGEKELKESFEGFFNIPKKEGKIFNKIAPRETDNRIIAPFKRSFNNTVMWLNHMKDTIKENTFFSPPVRRFGSPWINNVFTPSLLLFSFPYAVKFTRFMANTFDSMSNLSFLIGSWSTAVGLFFLFDR